MNRMMLASALTVIAVLGGSLAASAQDGHGWRGGMGGGMHGGMHGMGGPGMRGMGQEMMWERMDTNGDGTVTAEEYEAAAQDRFKTADTNGDGSLSAEEMVAAAEARREEMRKAMETRMMENFIDRRDTNDDGMLSYEEMTPGDQSGRFFERFDKDGDGQISKEEFEQAAKDRHGKRGERGEERRGH